MWPWFVKLQAYPMNALSYVRATMLSNCVQPPPSSSNSMRVPSGPWFGVRLITRSRTKGASATRMPSTRTVMLCGVEPPRSEGATKENVRSPAGPIAAVPRDQLTGMNPVPETRFPSIVHHSSSASAPGGSPVPVTVTGVPGGPWEGVTRRPGPVPAAEAAGLTSAIPSRIRSHQAFTDTPPDLRLLEGVVRGLFRFLGLRLRGPAVLPSHAGHDEPDGDDGHGRHLEARGRPGHGDLEDLRCRRGPDCELGRERGSRVRGARPVRRGDDALHGGQVRRARGNRVRPDPGLRRHVEGQSDICEQVREAARRRIERAPSEVDGYGSAPGRVQGSFVGRVPRGVVVVPDVGHDPDRVSRREVDGVGPRGVEDPRGDDESVGDDRQAAVRALARDRGPHVPPAVARVDIELHLADGRVPREVPGRVPQGRAHEHARLPEDRARDVARRVRVRPRDLLSRGRIVDVGPADELRPSDELRGDGTGVDVRGGVRGAPDEEDDIELVRDLKLRDPVEAVRRAVEVLEP